ncbi:hypothetical protein ANAPC5_01419 [Anaplasma phagocytophilum]|nr:hypothetical protein ANAPC5_01419 [Anaplasma phagocytophilum]
MCVFVCVWGGASYRVLITRLRGLYLASSSGVTVATAIDGGDTMCVRVGRGESVFLAPHRIVYLEFSRYL